MSAKESGSQRNPAEPSHQSNEGKLLETFMENFEHFAKEICTLVVHATPSGDQQDMITATGNSLTGQISKITEYCLELAGQLSPAQRIEVERFCKVQNGDAIARNALEIARQTLKKGNIFSKLLHFLSEHFKELKKIVEAILNLILGLLHIRWPKWLHSLFLIIDEIWDFIMSLLGDVFGIDMMKTARELSERECFYLAELAAVERLNAARAFNGTGETES